MVGIAETEQPPVFSAERSNAERLARPAGVDSQINWRYAIPIATFHALTLLALVPWLFSWSGLIIALIGTHVFGSGINIGYHRLLTHRSFQCFESVERFFVLLAICCFEDAPGIWVATHRLHHKDSDDKPDPHSPLVSFWWGHMGWLMFTNHDVHRASTYDRVARDVLRKPFYMWLQRGYNVLWIYLIHAALFVVAGFGVGWAWGGTIEAGAQLGLSWLVWAVIVRTVVVWHITWSVNSLSHIFGYRNYETREESRNNWFVAAIAAGEGWHNNHHQDPTAASNWRRWWEFDLSYMVIRSLELLGLAWDVSRPREMKID